MKRKIFSILFAVVLVLTLSLVTAVPAMAVDPVHNVTQNTYYTTIQAAIDAANPNDTINVAAGTYDEQVEINDSLTLQGVGDTTIIQPSGASVLTTVKTTPWLGTGTLPMAAIVFVDTAGETVTVKDLKIDGSGITAVPAGAVWVSGLAYLETNGTVERVAVQGYPQLGTRTCGIWTSAISSTSSVEVTECNVVGYNRGSIYACGATLTVDFNHNEVYGPGEIVSQVPNGMFFLRGATGSATYNTITDLAYTGETYRSTGIGTYRSGSGLLFEHNEIYNVQNAFAIAGASDATIEYNDIHDCHTGIKLEAIGDNRASDVMIQYNDIRDNDFAIRCGADMGDGNEAHYNNFVGNLGAEWVWGDTWIGAVCNVHETYTFDATNNWWGDCSGPGTVGPGSGDTVSANVDYDPWWCSEVDIDIKPGSDPNSINPNSKGLIAVAILGSATFDVTTVDVTPLRFGKTGIEASPAHDLTDPVVYAEHLQDVNGDSYMDLVCHFRTQDTDIAKGDTSATLTGTTTYGMPITGSDSVRTVGKP